jgi:hypothetical protein
MLPPDYVWLRNEIECPIERMVTVCAIGDSGIAAEAGEPPLLRI